ncbi:MAG: translation elongation factor Ts [Bacillota bacterium]
MITAERVKELRDRTGAGMMDCKAALTQAGGDLEKAVDILRKKGIAVASKKAGREAREGIVDAYIHLGGRIGVLLELNCETDFVARTPEFKELAHELSMQVAAARPLYTRREEIPAEEVEKERSLQRERVLAEGKPERVADKIVEGRMDKYYQELCLMEQAFIRDPSRRVSDIVTDAVARIGENITVGRFVRFEIGEKR